MKKLDSNLGKEEINKIPEIIRDLFALVHRLREICPGRNFTPDGHMVGDLGEAIAAYSYGIKLFEATNEEAIDGTTPDGQDVQIKATQRTEISIRHDCEKLLALKIHQNGSFEEIYNGNGGRVWDHAKTHTKFSNGRYSVPLGKLRDLQREVGADEKIPLINPFPS